MKDNTHSLTDSLEKKPYKKSYLVRLLEEKEASQEIERCIAFDQEELVYDTYPDRKPD